MAVSTQSDPLARLKSLITDKPNEIKASMDTWAAKQPVWVEGAIAGLQGSFQVRAAEHIPAFQPPAVLQAVDGSRRGKPHSAAC